MFHVERIEKGKTMENNKKRMTITIDQELHDLVEEYSTVSGLSKSTIIEGWIREASGGIRQLINLYGMIDTASDDQLSQIEGELVRLMDKMTEKV